MTVRIGETFIYGRTREAARQIMATCRALGVDRQSVRTTDTGFVVPNAVADGMAAEQKQQAWAAEDAVF